MPLTPADIHNVAFKKPPMGKRGYGEEEVDAFLDEAEQEMIRLLEANAALKEQVRRGPDPSATMVLDDEVASLAAQLDRLVAARDRAEQRARDMQAQLEQAHRDQTHRDQASAPAGPGDERDVRVLMMAQRTADEYLRDAERESDNVLAGAQEQADKLITEARDRAGTMESDAQRSHAQAMASLASGRADMLDEIDRLGRFARGYQEALHQHVAARLRDVDDAPEL
ncbi:DivIVA domain-containing protein [Actinoplanes aureus]|uniref:Cell wall synthesis protein Wag31 n=1 Tax=Actinoplanes aureus TaxID=2792083 RepID=A0A931G0R3_9ACTN|nr:DivIVA domain-containing protein [Actinoplanes aureus]MBG0565992.1 DivIVA domain-containing protein [Actinoplanes aureus]